METETGEVAFTQIEKEFKETFGYIRQDMAAIRRADLRLNYTVTLLICCACQMLAWHRNLKDDQVFTSLLPNDERYKLIGKTIFEALRNGLAHRFRPDTVKIGKEQWRFSIAWKGGTDATAIEGTPNWLQLNVKVLAERMTAQINEYEVELKTSPSARVNFQEKSKKCVKDVSGKSEQVSRIAEAWRSVIGKRHS